MFFLYQAKILMFIFKFINFFFIIEHNDHLSLVTKNFCQKEIFINFFIISSTQLSSTDGESFENVSGFFFFFFEFSFSKFKRNGDDSKQKEEKKNLCSVVLLFLTSCGPNYLSIFFVSILVMSSN